MDSESGTSVQRRVFWIRGGTLTSPDGRTLGVGATPVTVGRHPSATLCLDDPAVSAVHCELGATENGVVLRDLGSTNGTLVGSVALGEACLTGACTIRVGGTDLAFSPATEQNPVETEEQSSFGSLVGSSRAMRRLFGLLRRVSATSLSVLITGETGTGKEMVAKAIHAASERRTGPFVIVDCGAIASTLAESVLFGHEKGSFTGAHERRPGVLRQAHGGTVFLDELGELAPEVQPKLLRVFAEGTVQRVGATAHEPIDVRVLAATRRDLRREINANRFRSDLFFRVAQVHLDLPPLRERRQDIPMLVERACQRIGLAQSAELAQKYIATRFGQYDWPGNVRELMNVASVLASMGPGQDESLEQILPLEASAQRARCGDEEVAFLQAKRAFEESYFRGLLLATDGNISEMARRSGLARHQVRAHLRKLGLISA